MRYIDCIEDFGDGVEPDSSDVFVFTWRVTSGASLTPGTGATHGCNADPVFPSDHVLTPEQVFSKSTEPA